MAQHPGQLGARVDPVTKLPGELIHRTAELLTLNQRFSAALVSRAWRRVLFEAPLLWSTIAICPRTDGKPGFVAEVLDAFLQRSRGVTVTVRIFLKAKSRKSMHEQRKVPPSGDIAHVLEREMHRVRVLELVLNDWSRTPWKTVLRQPAPALERFVLIVSSGEDDNPLPTDLFANRAPALREVHLRSVAIPARPGAALARLTSFYYNYAGDFDGDVLKVICAMRNLEDLTIAATDESFHIRKNYQPPRLGPQLRRLQLWNAECARQILTFFPPPRQLCYSASLAHDLSAPSESDPALLVDAVHAKGAPRSVAIGFRSPRLSYFDSRPERSAVYAVRLDGSDVVVDLKPAELDQLVHALRPDSLLAGLQSLAIPVTLFPLFDLPGLPELHELTLFVPPPGDFPPLGDLIATQHTHRVRSLRIVQVIAPQQWPSWNMHKMRPAAKLLKQLPGDSVMGIIQDKLVAETLQQLVLDGYILAPVDDEKLRGVIPHISGTFTGGWLPDDDSGQWPWRFPKETAFRT